MEPTDGVLEIKHFSFFGAEDAGGGEDAVRLSTILLRHAGSWAWPEGGSTISARLHLATIDRPGWKEDMAYGRA